MKYKDITLKKYQIIKHIINKYAESHENVSPDISYDKNTMVLDISGISKPISFNTESIGIIPKGAYEVVGQAIRSKTAEGYIDENGMNIYDSAQRIFNIANTGKQEVFDFINEHSKSSYCSCCGTSRDRNKFFYIRRVDAVAEIYQVGSSCIKEYFDTSYFDLMKEISDVIEYSNSISHYQFTDYNLIDYLSLYHLFIKRESNIKSRAKKVVEILNSCYDISETSWYDEFISQKAADVKNILAISKFYAEYPNYIREDNAFAVKTIQSMAEMLTDNLDIDPYYSKSNCLNVAKMYTSLLQDFANDYRKYKLDLFKYNAYLVETALSNIWKEYNRTSYNLTFSLEGHVFNVSLLNALPPIPKNVKIVVPLDNEGNMVDEVKSKSEITALAAKVNESIIIKSQKNNVIDNLSKYKDKCLSRYSNFKPTITFKSSESSITFFDYTDDPIVINIIDDLNQAELRLGTFINLAYTRQKVATAYKEFSKKYIGKSVMAYTQPKQMNLQFSCSYAERQFTSHWPKDAGSLKISSYIDTTNKNIVIQYNDYLGTLKLPVNNIGIISGADYDISLRIQTFISKELGLSLPKVTKVRAPKTDEDIVASRPKKNVVKLFNSLGASAKNLISLRKVNILNDPNAGTLGVSIKDIGRIHFSTENGNIINKNDTYKGRIELDGHRISYNKQFDKKTFINAVHALEYLVFLSDENSNLLCNREVSSAKFGTSYTYKQELTCGGCKGNLQFRITHNGEKCILKYSPKFVIETTIDENKIYCMINLNFSEDCWKHIQSGSITLSDIQRNSNILHGQKNDYMISGTVWIGESEPQKLSNAMFTKLTGINLR